MQTPAPTHTHTSTREHIIPISALIHSFIHYAFMWFKHKWSKNTDIYSNTQITLRIRMLTGHTLNWLDSHFPHLPVWVVQPCPDTTRFGFSTLNVVKPFSLVIRRALSDGRRAMRSGAAKTLKTFVGICVLKTIFCEFISMFNLLEFEKETEISFQFFGSPVSIYLSASVFCCKTICFCFSLKETFLPKLISHTHVLTHKNIRVFDSLSLYFISTHSTLKDKSSIGNGRYL